MLIEIKPVTKTDKCFFETIKKQLDIDRKYGNNFNAIIDFFRYPNDFVKADDVNITFINCKFLENFKVTSGKDYYEILEETFSYIKDGWESATEDVNGNPLPKKLKFEYKFID